MRPSRRYTFSPFVASQRQQLAPPGLSWPSLICFPVEHHVKVPLLPGRGQPALMVPTPPLQRADQIQLYRQPLPGRHLAPLVVDLGGVYPIQSRLLELCRPKWWVASKIHETYAEMKMAEYRNKTLTKVFRSPYYGCYFLAATIFSLGIFRDFLYERAIRDQPHLAILSHPAVKVLAGILIASGQILAVTSIYALGLTGTYLGDYFGILMSERVTGFPFNLLSDPMYVGSTLTFLGSALWYQSPVGIAISALVWVVYSIALRFEGPWTDKIYSARSTSPAPTTKKPTASAPSTPRKSSRISAAPTPSYAAAAAEPRAPNGLPSATPRQSRKSVLATAREDDATASPRRMTRSRSKARGLGSGEDED
ncbi:hypothetical protein P7C73_g4903, partial [Tremellales sp. Uapishka_1]